MIGLGLGWVQGVWGYQCRCGRVFLVQREERSRIKVRVYVDDPEYQVVGQEGVMEPRHLAFGVKARIRARRIKVIETQRRCRHAYLLR